MRPHASASSSAASSIPNAPPTSSGSARWSSSRTVCARPGTGFEAAGEGLSSRRANRSPRGSSALRSRRARPSLAHRGLRRRRRRRGRAAPPSSDRRGQARSAGHPTVFSSPTEKHALAPVKQAHHTAARKPTPTPVAKRSAREDRRPRPERKRPVPAPPPPTASVRSRGYKIGHGHERAGARSSRSIVMYRPGFAGEGKRLEQGSRRKSSSRRSTACARRISAAPTVVFIPRVPLETTARSRRSFTASRGASSGPPSPATEFPPDRACRSC